MKYSLSNIRKEFTNYFIKHNHEDISSSSLIPHNDNSLLFTNAGMVQFKNVFLGLEKRDYKQATSVQKCLRAGGKHNDLDNVGFTARHHTFFEMLGNFSFGSYFKDQAIFYAYEFVNKILGINKEKLLVTVYHEDDESYKLWQKIAGFSSDKIIKINTNDNFWSMGNTGPAGPCTEIFYDLGSSVWGGPPGSKDADGDRFTEIWNLVFMQYNYLANGKIEKLATKAVDTGMGLERIAAVMQGVLDNYDTDLFKNIINNTENLLNVKVTENNKASFKVIADHIRASVFLISDGVLPTNEGRGYVLRRIIRRAIRHGYLLGSKEPIFYKLVPLITNLMNNAYPELNNSLNLAQTTILGEEEKFNKTLEDGLKLLEQSKPLIKNNILPGEIAFKLNDTYGFPLDLTESILIQENIKVNIEDFDKCMQAQKDLSKVNWIGSGEIQENECWFNLKSKFTTQFVGYENLGSKSEVLAILDENLKEKTSLNEQNIGYVLFNYTPFYPEGGGQLGDKGFILNFSSSNNELVLNNTLIKELWFKYKNGITNASDFSNNISSPDLYAEVLDTKKVAKDLIIHKVKVIKGELSLKQDNYLIVNQELRKSAAANHTATHILFATLKEVLGYDVAQQGSLVTPYRLRADVYLNKPLIQKQIAEVEYKANQLILSNLPISIEFMPYKEAINKGASFLMGENYPQEVRVVSIGKENNIVSCELCGGCHVNLTGEIGIFKIISESGIRSGVRRIEVVTGISALELFQNLNTEITFIRNALKSNKENVGEKLNNLIVENKDLKNKISNLESNLLISKITQHIEVVGNINILNINISKDEFSCIRNIIPTITSKYKPLLFIAISEVNEVVNFLIAISLDSNNDIKLVKVMEDLKQKTNVKGGGSNKSIQGSFSIKYKSSFESIIKNLIK